MSAFYERAEELAAVVRSAFSGVDVAVLVERGRGVADEFDRAVARVRGAVVMVCWKGASDVDEDIDEPRLGNVFEFHVACHPSLRAGDVRPDDVVETLCRAVNGWNPAGQQAAVRDVYLDMKVRSVLPREDAQLESYVVTAVQTIQL